jgi:hypothetical protein
MYALTAPCAAGVTLGVGTSDAFDAVEVVGDVGADDEVVNGDDAEDGPLGDGVRSWVLVPALLHALSALVASATNAAIATQRTICRLHPDLCAMGM